MFNTADLFPDEGLDLLLAVYPKGGAAPTNLFLGLYTANGGTSVPTGYTLAQLQGNGAGVTNGYAEVSATQWTTYQRITHPAGSWGGMSASTVWSTTGRIVTGSQLSFLAPTGSTYSPTQPLAGFFLANNIAQTAGSAVYYSNFSDGSTISSLAVGDVVKVTPSFGFGN